VRYADRSHIYTEYVNLIPVPLSLTCLFMLLPSSHSVNSPLSQPNTLTIHNSLSLSLPALPAQDLPLSQIFPTILLSSLRTDSTDFMTVPFLLSISVFMAALRSRCGHYIFVLLFLSIYLSFCFSSPNLSGRRLDVYHTSTHGVALVRI